MPTLFESAVLAVEAWRDDGAANGTLAHFTDRAAMSAGFSPADVYHVANKLVALAQNRERKLES